jgi:hypothetical protein
LVTIPLGCVLVDAILKKLIAVKFQQLAPRFLVKGHDAALRVHPQSPELLFLLHPPASRHSYLLSFYAIIA